MEPFGIFFSTQRLTSCWRKACLHLGGCVQGSFNCDYHFGNLSALHDFCSIDSTNTSSFDFGIFLEARQSRILESMDFPEKLIYSAWWGLRNLRFARTLYYSTYVCLYIYIYISIVTTNKGIRSLDLLIIETKLSLSYKQWRRQNFSLEGAKLKDDIKSEINLKNITQQ